MFLLLSLSIPMCSYYLFLPNVISIYKCYRLLLIVFRIKKNITFIMTLCVHFQFSCSSIKFWQLLHVELVFVPSRYSSDSFSFSLPKFLEFYIPLLLIHCAQFSKLNLPLQSLLLVSFIPLLFPHYALLLKLS